MEKYKIYEKSLQQYKEAKEWVSNKDKIDSQSGTRYGLHNISFTADYCGQAYAGANNYHKSPEDFNKYFSKAIKNNFKLLSEQTIKMMEDDCNKALIASEDELKDKLNKLENAKAEINGLSK